MPSRRRPVRPIRYERVPIEAVRRNNEIVARLYEWLNADGYEADFPALRELHPGLMSFESWLEMKGKRKLEELFRSS